MVKERKEGNGGKTDLKYLIKKKKIPTVIALVDYLGLFLQLQVASPPSSNIKQIIVPSIN